MPQISNNIPRWRSMKAKIQSANKKQLKLQKQQESGKQATVK